MKWNYVIIPLVVLAVAILGSYFTSLTMDWYNALKLPKIAPAGAFIGMVWTIIFILLAISALIYFNHANVSNTKSYTLILVLFIINAILNIAWSYIFFASKMPGSALLELVFLDLSVFLLIIFIWPISILSALLLVPYGLWVTFAGYLNYLIWVLNEAPRP